MENVAFETDMQIVNLAIDKISPNPNQPRKIFDQTSLMELAGSIKEYGVMQPINVRLVDGHIYELVAGERRLRASKLAGKTTIPSIIVNISSKESAILAIIENLQRQNLNFLEEADGFQKLIVDYNFTQEQLAEKIGKNQSTVANKLRILRLSPKIQKILLENELSERHARALLRLENEEEQIEILKKVVKENLTVKKTEELIERLLKKKEEEGTKKPEQKIKRYIKDIRLFTNTIKQAVNIMNDSGVETDYETEETDWGYEIKIKIKSQ